MPTEIFLYLKTKSGVIAGNAVQPGYERQIVLTGFSLNLENWEQGNGQLDQFEPRVRWHPLSIKKHCDDATPKLVAMMANHQKFELAEISVEDVIQDSLSDSGEAGRNRAMVIRLHSGFIDSLHNNMEAGDKAVDTTEEVGLSYNQIEVEFVGIDVDEDRRTDKHRRVFKSGEIRDDSDA